MILEQFLVQQRIATARIKNYNRSKKTIAFLDGYNGLILSLNFQVILYKAIVEL